MPTTARQWRPQFERSRKHLVAGLPPNSISVNLDNRVDGLGRAEPDRHEQ